MARGRIAPAKGRICLYPGSFNPLHVGHMMLAHYAHEHLGFDEVWLVLSPLNPLKDSRDTLPYTLRRQLIECAIAPYPYLRLETLEAHLPQPHYTVRSLRALHLLHPKATFAMLMGADSLASIGRWYEAERLLQETELYVYPRPDSIMEKRTDINRYHDPLSTLPDSLAVVSPDPSERGAEPSDKDKATLPLESLGNSMQSLEPLDKDTQHLEILDNGKTSQASEALGDIMSIEALGSIHLCHDAPTSPLSSTQIRTALANGIDASALLPCPHLWPTLQQAIQA